MLFKETIDRKIVSPEDAIKRTNALRIYGEAFMITYLTAVNLNAHYLQKLAEHKQDVNKLLVLISARLSKEDLILVANLQLVDFLCQTKEPAKMVKTLTPKKFVLEEPLPPEFAHWTDSYEII